MKRINDKNINIPELSDRIFKERWKECPHWVDWERFEKLAKYFEGGKYLDIGCFNSPMPNTLKWKYPEAEIHALDHAPRVIEKMQEYFPEVKYRLGNVLKTQYDDGYFNYVVAGELLEHIEKPEKLIKECFRVLKKSGWLALSTPYKEAQEGRSGISNEHIWSYDVPDIYQLLANYGKPETEIYKGIILTWCRYDNT